MTTLTPTSPLESPRRLLAVCFALASAWYLAWRWDAGNAEAPALSAALLALEVLVIAAVLLQAVLCWRFSQRKVQALTQPQPETDVLVWAGAHDPELLRKALLSARALQGPHNVYLLARQPATSHDKQALQALAAQTGCTLICGEGAGATPAALANQALAASHAPFLAWIDGSHACRRDFLQQTLGHFEHPQLAFVQSAPGFASDTTGGAPGLRSGFWQRWSAACAPVLAHRRLQQGWDRWQAALWQGSGAVLRRSALLAAGGFAGAGPDFFMRTTARLQAQGLHGAWHPERLAFSLAPESEASDRQRTSTATAWAVLLGEGVLYRPGMKLAQRLRYLTGALESGWKLATVLALALPAWALASGALPLHTTAPGFVQSWALHLLPLVLLLALLPLELSGGAHGTWARLGHRLARLSPPTQMGLVALNLGAAAAGLMLALAGPEAQALQGELQAAAPAGSEPLSAASTLALAAWALVNALALGAALQAAQRTAGRERHSQRFSVTLAAELVSATGERVQGTVDDLSDGGLRFYGSLLPSMAQQQQLTGTLHLPDGPLDFVGEVRHLGAGSNSSMHQPRSVGVKLQLDATGQARVEAFLYGSDLHWHLQGHLETPATPLGRLFPAAMPAPQPALARRHWNGAQLRLHVQAEATPVLCSARKGTPGAAVEEGQGAAEDDLVVSHSALPENLPLILDVFRRTAVPSRGVTLQRIEDPASVGATATALYTYRALPAAMPLVPVEHQVAASPFVVVDDQPLMIKPIEPEAPAVRNGKVVEAEALVAA